MPPPIEIPSPAGAAEPGDETQGSIYTSMGAPSPTMSLEQHQHQPHGLDRDDFHSEHRKTRMGPAVFALVNTVVGGGVLSLPYSFQLAGSLVGALVLSLSCLGTGFTLFCLISASRRTGARTFEDVMKAAFGTPAQVLVVVLVFIITFLTPVAYLILLRELVSPIVEAYVTHSPLPRLTQEIITGVLALLVTPLASLRSMGAIGSLAIFSMASMLVLAGTVVFRSLSCMSSAHHLANLPLVNLERPGDIVSSVPVFVCCFLCHFNVLPVFTELRRPTRDRGNALVYLTMLSTCVLYMVVGLFGYAYGVCRTGSVRDNVLSSFPPDDWLVNLARAALTVVLCFCFPLLLRPCRHTATRLYHIIIASATSGRSSSRRKVNHHHHHQQQQQQRRQHPRYHLQQVVEEEVREGGGDGGLLKDRTVPLLTTGDEEEDDAGSTLDGSTGSTCSATAPHHHHHQHDCRSVLLVTYALTAVVIAIASLVDSVAVMWEVMGSFACIAVAFICPPAAYLKVCDRRQVYKRGMAWLVLVSGVCLAVLCITQTITSLAAP